MQNHQTAMSRIMIQRVKKPLIATILLSFIIFSMITYFSGPLSEIGLEYIHLNHFN